MWDKVRLLLWNVVVYNALNILKFSVNNLKHNKEGVSQNPAPFTYSALH